MKKNKLLAVVAGVTTLAVSLTACGSKTTDDSENPQGDLKQNQVVHIEAEKKDKNPDVAKNRKDTLVVGVNELDGIFNPYYSSSAEDMYIYDNLFAKLFDYKEDGTTVPNLAEKYELSEDQKTYTFILKKDLKFSDGKPITAQDVAFGFQLVADPAYIGEGSFDEAKIVGYKEYKEGNADSISGIKIKDDRTISITLEEVNAKGLSLLGVNEVIPKHYYAPDFKKGDAAKVEELNRKPGPSSGAYVFKSYAEGQEAIVEANPNYVKGQPKIKTVIFKVTNKTTSMQMLQTGELDMFNETIKPEKVEQLKEMGFMDVYYWPNNGYGYIYLNQKHEILKDQKVRQALAYGLDRKKVVSSVYGDYANVLNIPQSKLSWAYTEEGIEPYEFDQEKAAKLLDEAGWKKGADGIREKDGKKMELKFWATTNNEVIDALIPVAKDNYEKLGIKLLAENMDFPTMRKKARDYAQGKSDIESCMWFLAAGIYSDPDESTAFKTGGSQNENFYSNKKVDELLNKGLRELDQEKRKDIYKQFYQEINKDLPKILMYQRSDGWAVNSRVKNFKMNPYIKLDTFIHQLELEQ